jgi:hypothetical protein
MGQRIPCQLGEGKTHAVKISRVLIPFDLLTFNSEDFTSFSRVLLGSKKRCRVIANADGAMTLVTNPKDETNPSRLLTWDLQRSAISF